jgi:DNA-binding NarL/FixJ family response regulator
MSIFLETGEVERMRANLRTLDERMRELGATLNTLRPRAALPVAPALPPVTLSGRERDILRLIAVGRENAEIAHEMHYALGTIKMHVREILAKLDATSRTEAAVRAVRLKLI